MVRAFIRPSGRDGHSRENRIELSPSRRPYAQRGDYASLNCRIWELSGRWTFDELAAYRAKTPPRRNVRLPNRLFAIRSMPRFYLGDKTV